MNPQLSNDPFCQKILWNYEFVVSDKITKVHFLFLKYSKTFFLEENPWIQSRNFMLWWLKSEDITNMKTCLKEAILKGFLILKVFGFFHMRIFCTWKNEGCIKKACPCTTISRTGLKSIECWFFNMYYIGLKQFWVS